MKLLLTGSTGFVGRNLLIQVLKNNKYNKIYLPVRSLEKLKKQLQQDGFSEIPPSLEPLICSAPDWDFEELAVDHLIHCAGILYANTKEQYFDTNVKGTLRLLQTTKTKKALILSSQSATGPCQKDEAERTEKHLERPLTWYGKSKLEMEKQVAKQFSNVDFLFLRPPLILGPRDSASLPIFKMANSRVRFKPGFKAKQFSFIAVSDLIEAIFMALEADWTTLSQKHFFVASNKTITDWNLIEGAGRCTNKNGITLQVPQPLLRLASMAIDRVPAWRKAVPSLTGDRAKEVWPDKWVVSPQAFMDSFDWKAKTELSDVLESTYDWYVKTEQVPAAS